MAADLTDAVPSEVRTKVRDYVVAATERWIANDGLPARKFCKSRDQLPADERAAVETALRGNAQAFGDAASVSRSSTVITFTGPVLEFDGAGHRWTITVTARFDTGDGSIIMSNSHTFEIKLSEEALEAAQEFKPAAIAAANASTLKAVNGWIAGTGMTGRSFGEKMARVPEEDRAAVQAALLSAAPSFADHARCTVEMSASGPEFVFVGALLDIQKPTYKFKIVHNVRYSTGDTSISASQSWSFEDLSE